MSLDGCYIQTIQYRRRKHVLVLLLAGGMMAGCGGGGTAANSNNTPAPTASASKSVNIDPWLTGSWAMGIASSATVFDTIAGSSIITTVIANPSFGLGRLLINGDGSYAIVDQSGVTDSGYLTFYDTQRDINQVIYPRYRLVSTKTNIPRDWLISRDTTSSLFRYPGNPNRIAAADTNAGLYAAGGARASDVAPMPPTTNYRITNDWTLSHQYTAPSQSPANINSYLVRTWNVRRYDGMSTEFYGGLNDLGPVLTLTINADGSYNFAGNSGMAKSIQSTGASVVAWAGWGE